jgi:hypothetical protein
MAKFRRFGSALVLATLVATGILTATPAYAAPPICRILDRALAAANKLPDSEYKDALITYIVQEQAEYGCN